MKEPGARQKSLEAQHDHHSQLCTLGGQDWPAGGVGDLDS